MWTGDRGKRMTRTFCTKYTSLAVHVFFIEQCDQQTNTYMHVTSIASRAGYSPTYLFSPIRLSIFLRALASITETSLSSCDTFLNPFSPANCTGAATEGRDAITRLSVRHDPKAAVSAHACRSYCTLTTLARRRCGHACD